MPPPPSLIFFLSSHSGLSLNCSTGRDWIGYLQPPLSPQELCLQFLPHRETPTECLGKPVVESSNIQRKGWLGTLITRPQHVSHVLQEPVCHLATRCTRKGFRLPAGPTSLLSLLPGELTAFRFESKGSQREACGGIFLEYRCSPSLRQEPRDTASSSSAGFAESGDDD